MKRSVEGSRLGLWSSSSPTSLSELKRGLAHLEKAGLPYFFPNESRRYATRKESAARHFLAGPDENRAHALSVLWQDSTVREIVAIRGGYGSLRLLPYLDRYLSIPTSPKRLWGYSDVTIPQNYLYGRFGLPWVHSPMVTSRAWLSPTPKEKASWKSLLSPEPSSSCFSLRVVNRPAHGLHVGERLRAPMIGGNLITFTSMFASPWQPNPEGAYFLFLEDIGEAPRRVDRTLVQLSHSGVLSRCRAVLTGHFTECEGAHALIRAWAKEKNIPLIKGVPSGHESPHLPLPMGEPVELAITKSDRAELRFANPRLMMGFYED